MKLLKIQNYLNFFINLKFAILLLFLIVISSSLGSFIEQDEPVNFYQENYPLDKPIYGFINFNIILFLGLDHIYRTWWFFLLLILLGTSLIICTILRQFPLVINSKEYLFKKEKKSFSILPFFVKMKTIYYLKELILLKIQSSHFYIYQTKNVIYGFKGLIGRISPILVHFSLLLILVGSSFGAFNNFKAQEILPKGELFHIQNPLRVGWFTPLPSINTRINDFWVEFENQKIHQFYSNLSILDNYGNELKNQTISVNNPLRYKTIDFYQSDWNNIGIRIKKKNKIVEFPFFSLKKNSKNWITWIENPEKNYTLIFNELENTFLIYDQKGNFLKRASSNDFLDNDNIILDVIPSTGLLIKYDPSIGLIYLGFGLLMLTGCLSYLPYTQIWIFQEKQNSFLGSLTNRGKIQVEIEFENLLRYIENTTIKTNFSTLKK